MRVVDSMIPLTGNRATQRIRRDRRRPRRWMRAFDPFQGLFPLVSLIIGTYSLVSIDCPLFFYKSHRA